MWECLKYEFHLLAKFSSDVTETLYSVKAHRLETSVTKHLGDLGDCLSWENSYVTWLAPTWAYSCPSSLKISSLLTPSFSFLPLLLFFPPFPLFLGMVSHEVLKGVSRLINSLKVPLRKLHLSEREQDAEQNRLEPETFWWNIHQLLRNVVQPIDLLRLDVRVTWWLTTKLDYSHQISIVTL